MVFVLFTLLIIAVQGKQPLEIATSGYKLDLSTRGVDAESCNRMVYQVKSCMDHGMLLLNGEGKDLVEFVIGGWYNTKSVITIFPTGTSKASSTRFLHCDEFRWVWMSWDAGRIKYGEGRVPGTNVGFELAGSIGRQVKRFGLKKINWRASTIRLGETERGRFARMLQEGKFSDGIISETSTSREDCASLCTEHNDCGMFSYNQILGLCALFDRMTSSFAVTSESGWISWKLLYCYP